MNQLYKFYNQNASSVRAILIANCPFLEPEYGKYYFKTLMERKLSKKFSNFHFVSTARPGSIANVTPTETKPLPGDYDEARCSGNPMSHTTLRPSTSGGSKAAVRSGGSADSSDLPYSPLLEQNCPRYIQYSDEFRQEYEDSYCESSDDCVDDDDDEDMDEDDLSEEDLDNGCPKYLIFSTGSKTYTPHQIGFKRVRSTNFPKKLEPGLSLKERIVAKERERRMQVSLLFRAWGNSPTHILTATLPPFLLICPFLAMKR